MKTEDLSGDLVVSFDTCGGEFIRSKCCIFVKDGESYKTIGYVTDMNIQAPSNKDISVDLSFTSIKSTEKEINQYVEILRKLGCTCIINTPPEEEQD